MKDTGQSATLRYIPEVSVADLDNNKLIITEERGDFDYIYSVSDFITIEGKALKVSVSC